MGKHIKLTEMDTQEDLVAKAGRLGQYSGSTHPAPLGSLRTLVHPAESLAPEKK